MKPNAVEPGLSSNIVQIRSFVAWTAPIGESNEYPQEIQDTTGASLKVWGHDRLRVAYRPRIEAREHVGAGLKLLLGDGSDLDDAAFLTNSASGVPIMYDAAAAALRISTSIVGMPPVFLYRGARVTAITSDIHLLLHVPGAELEFDPAAVVELGRVGHPIEQRTLFRNLTLVESGARLAFTDSGNVSATRSWNFPDVPPLEWSRFLEAQIAAFSNAVMRTRTTQTILSLTAGLDTRTVFAALAAQGRLMPAVTMSGAQRMSLDAMTARRLCEAYGTEHFLVTFADDFAAQLPEHLETASLLSGGLSSLDQAPEVYLYRQLGSRFNSRLSGNLGNQVGRGGTEGVSVRGADLGILDARFHAAQGGTQNGHWLLSRLNDSQRARTQFILQNETVFTLVGNYTIGNHFAAQQSPYANRELIEALALRPIDQTGSPSGSKLRMRLRDLGHRFHGEPEDRSFQRTLVRRIGGFAAQYPVNWGWRPAGGISPAGIARGVATLGGMYARAKGLDSMRFAGAAAAFSRLAELHDFRNSRTWLKTNLREYTYDALAARATREAGLFDHAALQKRVDAHFTDRADHYDTIVFALDLVLAHRLFRQRVTA